MVLEKILDLHPADRARELGKLQELMEARFFGLDRAIEVADTEREKAAGVIRSEQEKAAAQLRSEQHRALDQANEEREKAATQLRVELARAINEGDDRLREHIANQIMQIRSALESSEKLELERLARVDADVRALAREQAILRETSNSAQNKFEIEVSDRFKQVNEFRASLDDLGKTMATRRELEAVQVTSGERYDDVSKQLQELRSRLDTGPADLRALQQRFDLTAGRGEGVSSARQESRAGLSTLQGMMLAGAAVLGLLFSGFAFVSRSPSTVTVPTVVTVPVATTTR